MERQSKGSRGQEAYCKGGQGPPRAVAPPKKKKTKKKKKKKKKLWLHIIFLASVTLANTNNEFPEDGVTAPKHVGSILM